jgi:2',3'-cyclic-nucleotide 2'-phosphodiesterase (5'-nucleotidase family)
MNPEIHVYLIPNFCVENKIVGKQNKKNFIQIKSLTIVFLNIGNLATYKQMFIPWIIIERNHFKITYIGISPLYIHPSF